MGVTTRAAAARKAKAGATKLLDLPDGLIERILVAASGGGQCGELRAARLACSRLRAAADAAARIAAVNLVSLGTDALEPLAVLPRLAGLKRLQLELGYGVEKAVYDNGEDDAYDLLFETASDLSVYLKKHCRGVTDLWLRSAHVGPVMTVAVDLELLMDFDDNQSPPPSPSSNAGPAGHYGLPLPFLTSLSLDWGGNLRQPLAPLARLTLLTALELRSFAAGIRKTNWLPPNLEELRLSAGKLRKFDHPYGIGGAGWLAALHPGACPRLRALHLSQLALCNYKPRNPHQGVTLANTLPRLTALEELDVTAYESADADDYDWSDSDSDDSSDADAASNAWLPATPIPAAPLLAALLNLRHCRVAFVRRWFDRDGEGMLPHDCRTTPMLLITPAELAALRAPKLESLLVGLVTSPYAEGNAWRCGDPALAAAPASAATTPPAGGGAGRSGLPALRSLELHVGCNRVGTDSVWGLSALPPGSLPALRRLLVLPISFGCGATMLPLDAVSRAAPGLERLVIDPRCAGPLDALFCAGGCALSLRWLMVLRMAGTGAAVAARIDGELLSGLCERAAALRRQGFRSQPPIIKVTLFGDPQSRSVATSYPRGSAVVRRLFCSEDGRYVNNFLHTGLRCGTLPSNAREDRYGVAAYERAQHA